MYIKSGQDARCRRRGTGEELGGKREKTLIFCTHSSGPGRRQGLQITQEKSHWVRKEGEAKTHSHGAETICLTGGGYLNICRKEIEIDI